MSSLRRLQFAHRWLGIALGVLFVAWFASGIVMLFVPYPRLTDAERMAALPTLDLRGCCVAPADALAPLRPAAVEELRLDAADDGQPRYRVLADGRWRVLDARTGRPIAAAGVDEAARIAERARPDAAARAVTLLERDQWTVAESLDAYRPLARVDLDDAAGSSLYVSLVTREVVRDTHARERFWNWLGSVPHWIYPTMLRQSPRAWHHVVVALSAAGIAFVLTGIALGIARLRGAHSPYREPWMRWHHVTGLAAMAVLLAWILSGFFSMNPLAVFAARTPSGLERHAWTGGALALDRLPARALAALAVEGGDLKEIVVRQVGGVPYLEGRFAAGRRAIADGHGVRAGWDADALSAAAVRAFPGGRLLGARVLHAHDEYYYPRGASDASRPLPALRLFLADGVWLDVDATSGAIVQRSAPSTRAGRWLFRGLHTWDWAWMRAHPQLRIALLLAFSLVGLAASFTGVWLALRHLRRGARASRPRPTLAPIGAMHARGR